eukprot:gene9503-biopygen4864
MRPSLLVQVWWGAARCGAVQSSEVGEKGRAEQRSVVRWRAVQNSAVRCCAVQWECGALRCGSCRCGVVQCTGLQSSLIWPSTCGAVRCSAVHHSAEQCSAEWCTALHGAVYSLSGHCRPNLLSQLSEWTCSALTKPLGAPATESHPRYIPGKPFSIRGGWVGTPLFDEIAKGWNDMSIIQTGWTDYRLLLY